mgnify:CR=1 FL=1
MYLLVACFCSEFFHELLIYWPLHQDPVCRDTSLPRVPELGRYQTGDCSVHIRRREHDEWCIATELKSDPLDGVTAETIQHLSNLRRS